MILSILESLVSLWRQEVSEDTLIQTLGQKNSFDRFPCVTLAGPEVKENLSRRSKSKVYHKDHSTNTFVSCSYPRLFNLVFHVSLFARSDRELIELVQSVHQFFFRNLEIQVGSLGTLPLTVINDVGSIKLVNLSNLCQATGRFQVEDCPIFDDQIKTGVLILEPVVSVESGF